MSVCMRAQGSAGMQAADRHVQGLRHSHSFCAARHRRDNAGRIEQSRYRNGDRLYWNIVNTREVTFVDLLLA